MIENIDIKQAPPANITASRSMILNTSQIDSDAVITQA